MERRIAADTLPVGVNLTNWAYYSRSSPTENHPSDASRPSPVALSRVTNKSKSGVTPASSNESVSTPTDVYETPITIEAAGSQPPKLSDFVTEYPEGLTERGYIVEGTIGGGGCAKVKKGLSLRFNREVAIKISDLKKGRRDIVQKFLPREIITLRQLSGNERIVQLYETFLSADKLYMVLEYVEHGDLLDYICEKKRLSESTSRRFYMDILSALSACHRLGIIHRDVKCENFLIDGNYRLKLTDFGFARLQRSNCLVETYCGSLAYAAPEVIQEKPYVGKTADIWSSGVVLYAMLSGRLPFDDSDVKSMIGYINDGVIIPRGFTITASDLIIRIFSTEPKDRPTIRQILKHPFMRVDPEKTTYC